MTQCPNCGSTSVGYDEAAHGCLLCEECGLVIEEDQVRLEPETYHNGDGSQLSGLYVTSLETVRPFNSGTTWAPIGMRNIPGAAAKNKVLGLCSRICSLLRMSRALSDQVEARVAQYMENRWSGGRKAELLVAACAYIICRTHAKPVSLLDVSEAVQCNVFELGRVYTKVVTKLKINLPEIDPALFIERTVSQLTLDTDNQRFVIHTAMRFVEIAKDDWLNTGRKPSTVVAAAISLALEMKDIKVDVKKVSGLLNVGVGTVRSRCNEMKGVLIQTGKTLLPWGVTLDKKNIMKHAPEIMKHLDFVNKSVKNLESAAQDQQRLSVIPVPISSSNVNNGDTERSASVAIPAPPSTPTIVQKLKQSISQVSPPAHYANRMKREKRKEKLERAKKRILVALSSNFLKDELKEETHDKEIPLSDMNQDLNATVKASQNVIVPITEDVNQIKKEDGSIFEGLDQDDMLIERLLLQGVDESVIIEGDYLTSNFSVSSLFSLGPVRDDPELSEKDIPDCQLGEYIKSEREIERLSDLSK